MWKLLEVEKIWEIEKVFENITMEEILEKIIPISVLLGSISALLVHLIMLGVG